MAHVRCKTNNNILLFYPFVQDANDSFVPCFAFVLCIMTSAVQFYMDHKPCVRHYCVDERLSILQDIYAACVG